MIPSLDAQTPKETFEVRAKKLRSDLVYEAVLTCVFFMLFTLNAHIIFFYATAGNFSAESSLYAVVTVVTAVFVCIFSRGFTKALTDYLRLMAEAVQNHWL